MGSDSPFLDDTIPFSEHARGMKDDELLDIWEQVLLRKRRRTAPFFDLFSDTGRNHIRAMSSKSAGLHREAGLRCAVLSPEIPFFHSILFISKKV